MRTPDEKLRDNRVISTVLNFIPKVGAAKIITEAVIGEDLITKEKISYLDRASSILLLSRFHLGDLNLKKVEGVKRKEPYREKPSTRIRKTPEKGRPKDIVLVEGKDGVLEAPKNSGSSKNGTNVKKVGDKNLSVTKEPTKDVTNTVKGTSVTQNQNNLTKNLSEKNGGRKGSSDTRLQNKEIVKVGKSMDWIHTAGANLKEEYMKGENGVKGANYIDVTLTKYINGKEVKVRINTVDTYKKTGDLTNREAKAEEMINIKIEREGENPKLKTIPKGQGIGDLKEYLKAIEEEYKNKK